MLVNGTQVNFTDKIRPKWDWKFDIIETELKNAKEIKSDQNGIEKYVKQPVFKQSNSIKSDQNGIEKSTEIYRAGSLTER